MPFSSRWLSACSIRGVKVGNLRRRLENESSVIGGREQEKRHDQRVHGQGGDMGLTDSYIDLVLAGILLEILGDTYSSARLFCGSLGLEVGLPRMGSWGLQGQQQSVTSRERHTPEELVARSW